MPQTAEILNDIKTVLDISSRVDERVKIIQGNQQELYGKINQFTTDLSALTSRVIVLESKNGGKVHEIQQTVDALAIKLERIDAGGTESHKKSEINIKDLEGNIKNLEDKIDSLILRVQSLETHKNNWQEMAKLYGGLFLQGLLVVVVSWILFKIGLPKP